MNASSAVASAIVLFTLGASSASALVTHPQAISPAAAEQSMVAKADFVQGHEAVYGIPARQAVLRAQASSAMAERYFDVDVIVTLGALALASGAFIAVGIAGSRKRAVAQPASTPREGWREEVMQALESDLAQFTVGLRQAA